MTQDVHAASRTKVLTALLAALSGLLLWANSASALTYGLDTGPAANEFLQVKKSGATVFRLPLDRSQTADGANWSFYNPIFEEAWQYGITLQPVLIRSSGGASQFPTSSEYAGWNEWVQKVIRQYGPSGYFWSGKANPRPVTSWEVWNEPNLAANNPGGATVQPQNYARFLITTSNAIKAVQPGATVLFGGLYLPGGRYYRSFLEEAATVAGEQNAFSAIAIHPYAFINKIPEMAELINGARSAANAFGGSGKPLVINEFGWPTEFGAEKVPSVSEAEQASLLKQGFDWIKGHAAELNISTVYWFNLRDVPPANAGDQKWDKRCGLRREDGSYRPAWYAYQEAAGASKWPTAPAEAPSVIAVLTPSEELYVKQGSLTGEWVKEGGGIKSVSVASNPSTGPLIGVITNNGHALVKVGLFGEWIDETAGASAISVATDATNGPLIGVLTNTGHALVKKGNLFGEWIDETAGASAISVATSPAGGPLIGVLLNDGHALAKEGNLFGEWVDEFGGVNQVKVAH